MSPFAIASKLSIHFMEILRKEFVYGFGEWATDQCFPNKILFSDIAHFWLNGYANKQDSRIWCDDNSEAIVKPPLRYAVRAEGVCGPYFITMKAAITLQPMENVIEP